MEGIDVTGQERVLKSSEIISTRTDPQGIVTFVNPAFISVTGFSRDEAIGKPHNLIRHPCMPRSVYYLLWKTIREGETFFGLTLNRCKNGDHYWTLGYFHPDVENGNITGFRSTRQGLRNEELKTRCDKLYRSVRQVEQKLPRPDQVRAGFDALQKELKKLGYADYQSFAKLAL
ncbi:MAG: PAS domain-containing protein [Pseudomonadota bacterium]|jgi:PAS domain S-box-containing protein